MITTTDSLLMAADVLHGLPGLAPISVTCVGCAVTFHVYGKAGGSDADDHARAFAVDALAAVLNLEPKMRPAQFAPACYAAEGDVGEWRVQIIAPGVEVVVPV